MQIIFIHGLGQTPSSWDKTVSCLSEQITAQCPDLSSLLNDAESTYENLYDNTDWIDPNNLHRFAEECLMSDDRNIVKYGMEMIEVFSEPNESIKEIIRTLGLSDEFTMDEMVSEPTDCVELGAKYQNYTRLMFLIQELKPYPLCGVDFVELGLRSPVVNNRNMSLRVLDSWCKIKQCSLHELSEELFNCVAELKEKEVSDSVKKSIEEYGF